MVGLDGLEPSTPALSRRCSNQLSYRPIRYARLKNIFNDTISVNTVLSQEPFGSLCKGGDPAAPSGTATLLRLHPSHETHRGRRPPCG